MITDSIIYDTVLPLQSPQYVKSVAIHLQSVEGQTGLYAVSAGQVGQIISVRTGGLPLTLPELPEGGANCQRTVELLREVLPYRKDNGRKLYDLRCYSLGFGKGEEYAQLFCSLVAPERVDETNYGIWLGLSGRTDRVFHLWGYDSHAHREQVLAQVSKADDWQAYIKKAGPMMISMRSSLMTAIA